MIENYMGRRYNDSMEKKFLKSSDNNSLQNDLVQEKEQKKFFITTPIYYATDAPHLGSAYTTIVADVYKRWLKAQGRDVFLLTGTDEHGAKVSRAAENAKMSVQTFVDEKSLKFKKAWEELGVDYDDFARTTNDGHKKKVQDFISILYQKKWIERGKYSGLYCVGCETFKLEKDFVDGKCPDHQTVPENVTEEAYFFRLSDKKLTEPLKKWVKNSVFPISRQNEVLSFIKLGLEDVAITRKNLKWGIICPWDDSNVLYVWIDALLNYWTYADGNWPPDLQIIGKDILRFHAIIWPAILLAYFDFDETKLPKKLFAHGFFTTGGQKMSKSLGNKIDPLDISQKYGSDGLRYYLLNVVNFGNDGDVSLEDFEKKYNADLANDLGNLVQRTLTLSQKYGAESLEKEDLSDFVNIVNSHFEKLEFSLAIQDIFNFIKEQNILIDQLKPWELVKTDEQAVKKLLAEILYRLEIIAGLLQPVMPEISMKIISQISGEEKKSPIFPKNL